MVKDGGGDNNGGCGNENIANIVIHLYFYDFLIALLLYVCLNLCTDI